MPRALLPNGHCRDVQLFVLPGAHECRRLRLLLSAGNIGVRDQVPRREVLQLRLVRRQLSDQVSARMLHANARGSSLLVRLSTVGSVRRHCAHEQRRSLLAARQPE